MNTTPSAKQLQFLSFNGARLESRERTVSMQALQDEAKKLQWGPARKPGKDADLEADFSEGIPGLQWGPARKPGKHANDGRYLLPELVVLQWGPARKPRRDAKRDTNDV